MKKGFTLIELLAVIILLAIIALISTPIILNIIAESKKSADKTSMYMVIDAAKNYYGEILLDDSKKEYLSGRINLFDKITISGNKPDNGVIYINEYGEVAMSTIYNGVCYKKTFSDNEVTETDDLDNCDVVPYGVVCKRGVKLHTEECQQTSNHCYAAGYVEGQKGTTITYGNLGEMGNDFVSGDAFDCDVDGDGFLNWKTERFYYVSSFYDTKTKTFDDSYAVLIYYDATKNGNNSYAVKYDSTNANINGPISAIINLPTTSTWSNVKLKESKRKILGHTSSDSTSGGKITSEFDYTGYAARLLTAQEINEGCNTYVGSYQNGQLDKCNYLLENTKYATPSKMLGYWLETPTDNTSNKAWHVYSYLRNVYSDTTNNTFWGGVRPAIEVPTENILF